MPGFSPPSRPERQTIREGIPEKVERFIPSLYLEARTWSIEVEVRNKFGPNAAQVDDPATKDPT